MFMLVLIQFYTTLLEGSAAGGANQALLFHLAKITLELFLVRNTCLGPNTGEGESAILRIPKCIQDPLIMTRVWMVLCASPTHGRGG